MQYVLIGAAGKSPGSQEVQTFTRTTSLSAASMTLDGVTERQSTASSAASTMLVYRQLLSPVALS